MHKTLAALLLLSATLLAVIIPGAGYAAGFIGGETVASSEKSYIKWIDFGVTCEALTDAMNADIKSQGSDCPLDWITILSLVAARNGGNFKNYKSKTLSDIVEKLSSGTPPEEITSNAKLYRYYLEAYGAVLGGMLGEYTLDGEAGYGLTAYSPIASGYYYNHFDDFGAARSYGYKRTHLGHDLIGSVGTPVIAVESGYVEAVGWNQYGGWRIGIRSFDGKRYYYYAHLRKNHPYNDIYEGKVVNAGEVIGYLGMTGYSSKENVNNIDTPHLHYGLQIIMDPSQKDGVNQIWIDMYELTKFLARNKSKVYRDADANEYYNIRSFVAAATPD